MVNLKIKISILILVCLLVMCVIISFIYLSFPEFTFILEHYPADRCAYKFSIYDRFVVVTAGYKEPVKGKIDYSASSISITEQIKQYDEKLASRKENFKINVVTGIDLFFLSKQEYKQIIKSYNNAEITEEPIVFSVTNSNWWNGYFKGKDDMHTVTFSYNEKVSGDEALYQIILKVIPKTDILLIDTYGTDIYGNTNRKLEPSGILEQIMFRVWPIDSSQVETDGFIDNLLWKVFPVTNDVNELYNF